MKRLVVLIASAAVLVCGCELFQALKPGGRQPRGQAPVSDEAHLRVDPLPVQQARAYPETVTGIFASLADFEDVPGGEKGHAQVAHFAIDPASADGRLQFVVNITRTGVGALEVTLPARSELAFRVPHVHDLRGYKLLSIALYARSLRDDLRVTLATHEASWQGHRTLVQPGWNNVLVDIQRLADVKGFDVSSVQSIRVAFADAAGPVWFNLDDIMVIDNARTIRPAPPGLLLRKSGLDYGLKLPGDDGEIALAQGPDGLWRLEGIEAQIRLAAAGQTPGPAGEDLGLMGQRRVGQVELLEHNSVRLRLANTWYFPDRAGEWASLAVRGIRWEHTFYADGRCVTQGTLNNAGGREIGSVELRAAVPAAWAGGGLAERFVLGDLVGQVGRWRYLIPPSGPGGKTVAANYLRPGRIEPAIAAEDAFAPGDAARDGFDESQGCFFLGARSGHCRFTVRPPPEGLWNPLFLVSGRWSGAVHVGSEGLTIRRVARCADGSVLFALPGLIGRATAVEVTGKPAGEGP